MPHSFRKDTLKHRQFAGCLTRFPSLAVQGAAPMGFSLNSAVEPSVMNAASGLGAFNLTARSAGETERVGKLPVEIKPLGYVVKGDGQFAAIVSADDDVYVVRPGDRFAGRYRALSVSADLVEAVEDPPRQPPVPSFMAPADFPDLLSASAQQRPPLSSGEDCGGCKFSGVGEVSAKVPQRPPGEVQAPLPRSRMGLHTVNHHGQGAKAPKEQSAFIFQTLGTVETQDGQVQAIVADGSQLYLVKQGETFADQYQATSVDPLLVLAVKLSPGETREQFPRCADRIRRQDCIQQFLWLIAFFPVGGGQFPDFQWDGCIGQSHTC